MDHSELEELRRWIGKKETKPDTASLWPALALAATLDRNDALPKLGDDLPLGWHWLYFLETVPTSELDADGHVKRGQFLPPISLPRRMSAGGRIEFKRPLRIGEPIRRDSEIVRVEAKRGRTGELVFVTVRHTVFGEREVAVIEEHDIVYRHKDMDGVARRLEPPTPLSPQWQRCLFPNSVLLFRYSALTFMAHRIHYDLEYAQSEGYPALLVQGPLQTLLLLDLCRRNENRPVKRLEYRAANPVFHTERFTVNGTLAEDGLSATLWVANEVGQCAMKAKAAFEDMCVRDL